MTCSIKIEVHTRKNQVNIVLPRKERDFALREKEIIDVALELFQSPDWQQVTVAEIAKAAGIGKGTVYKHFESKEEIHATIALTFECWMLDILRKTDQPNSFEDVLTELTERSFDLFAQFPAHAKVFYHYKHLKVELLSIRDQMKKCFTNNQQEHEALVYKVLEDGIAQGAIPDKPIKHLLVGISATFNGALNMMWDGQAADEFELSHKELVNIISRYMLAGIKGL